jgi:hypothetical protein
MPPFKVVIGKGVAKIHEYVSHNISTAKKFIKKNYLSSVSLLPVFNFPTMVKRIFKTLIRNGFTLANQR